MFGSWVGAEQGGSGHLHVTILWLISVGGHIIFVITDIVTLVYNIHDWWDIQNTIIEKSDVDWTHTHRVVDHAYRIENVFKKSQILQLFSCQLLPRSCSCARIMLYLAETKLGQEPVAILKTQHNQLSIIVYTTTHRQNSIIKKSLVEWAYRHRHTRMGASHSMDTTPQMEAE